MDPILAQTPAQAEYERELRDARRDLGLSPSWSTFLHQLIHVIALRAVVVVGALAGAFVLTRLLW